MDSNTVLGFIRKPEKSTKSVYDRLYLDMSKRVTEHKSVNNASSVLNPTRSINNPGKVEDYLMQRHCATRSKLKVIKARHQAEEMKEVHPIPEINPISRILASKQQDKSREVKSAYIKSILSTSRFTKSYREQSGFNVKTATIRIDDLDLRPVLCKAPASNSAVQENNLDMLRLRNAVSSRENVGEPEKAVKLLDMDVISRGNHWTTLKQKHLQQVEQEMTERGMEGCTFSPALTPRMNISKRRWASASRSTARINCSNASYSQIFLNKKQGKEFNCMKKTNKFSQAKTPLNLKSQELISKNKSSYYRQLSPNIRKSCYKNDLNTKKFIDKIRPIGNYKLGSLF